MSFGLILGSAATSAVNTYESLNAEKERQAQRKLDQKVRDAKTALMNYQPSAVGDTVDTNGPSVDPTTHFYQVGGTAADLPPEDPSTPMPHDASYWHQAYANAAKHWTAPPAPTAPVGPPSSTPPAPAAAAPTPPAVSAIPTQAAAAAPVASAIPAPALPGPVPNTSAPVPTAPTRALDLIRANPEDYFSNALGGQVRVTSGQRTPRQNLAAHGSPTSSHLDNEAWDIKPPSGMTTAQVTNSLASSGIPYDQIIDEGTHVHFGMGHQMRGMVMSGDDNRGYTTLSSRQQATPAPAAPPSPAAIPTPPAPPAASADWVPPPPSGPDAYSFYTAQNGQVRGTDNPTRATQDTIDMQRAAFASAHGLDDEAAKMINNVQQRRLNDQSLTRGDIETHRAQVLDVLGHVNNTSQLEHAYNTMGVPGQHVQVTEDKDGQLAVTSMDNNTGQVISIDHPGDLTHTLAQATKLAGDPSHFAEYINQRDQVRSAVLANAAAARASNAGAQQTEAENTAGMGAARVGAIKAATGASSAQSRASNAGAQQTEAENAAGMGQARVGAVNAQAAQSSAAAATMAAGNTRDQQNFDLMRQAQVNLSDPTRTEDQHRQDEVQLRAAKGAAGTTYDTIQSNGVASSIAHVPNGEDEVLSRNLGWLPKSAPIPTLEADKDFQQHRIELLSAIDPNTGQKVWRYVVHAPGAPGTGFERLQDAKEALKNAGSGGGGGLFGLPAAPPAGPDDTRGADFLGSGSSGPWKMH